MNRPFSKKKLSDQQQNAPKLTLFNEKGIEKDYDNFWHRKLFLKVRNWLFSMAWFRVDKKNLWKSAIFHSIKPPFDAEVDEKFLNVI